MNSPSSRLLTVEELTIRFPLGGRTVTAVDGISFHISRGEALGLVGESGSGKTITAQAIPRIIPSPGRIDGGRVLLDGTDLTGLSERQLRPVRGRRIGMIFQEPMSSLNPTMTIGAQVAETLQLHTGLKGSEIRDHARTMLERVRLPDPGSMMTRYPHQLSGGMQQRAMIAMALACDPDLLIADEPTTALDVTVQAEILDLIDEARRDLDMAVLFITHNIAVVARIADRLAVMQDGRIVEIGNTAELIASPRSDYAQNLLNAVPRLGGGPHPRKQPADISDQPVLAMQGMSKSYPVADGLFGGAGRKTVLQPTDLEIHRGETLAIVGASGCGKTTLTRCLTRLIDADSGEVVLNGAVMEADDPRLRQAVQMVFQDPFGSLNPRWSIRAILREPMQIAGQISAARQLLAIDRALEQVGLDPAMADRYPHQFSGGQRQRIAIARALILNPRLIVADEPVSALDVSVQAQILDLLADLQADLGLSILLISHDIAVVERLADRIAVMAEGRIVEIGPTRHILDNPQTPTTRELIAAVPRLPERAA